MTQSNDFAKVQVNAEKAMALLKDRRIRQIPQNYTIWYEYLTDTNPDLMRAVNKLVAENGTFTEKIARQIYSEFFTFEKEGKAIQETNRLVQKSMDNVIGDLNISTTDFLEYSEHLSGFSEKAATLSVTELQTEIGAVINRTSAMADSANALKNGLDVASREIAALKRRLQDVQKEALTDTLTGIANRKAFDTELTKGITKSQETDTQLCLIMSDIDHFKNFNDKHGHPFGDQVLKLVANTLNGGIGRMATAARYGGEEFGIILPNTELSTAVDIANDLRVAVSAKKLVKRSTGDAVGKITMSFGVALYAPCEDAGSLINRADEALYLAKNSGRNRVKHMQSSLEATG